MPEDTKIVTSVTQELHPSVLNDTPPAEQVTDPQQPATEDLLTRVSKFVADPGGKPTDEGTDGKFNSEELNTAIAGIEDPALKTKMEGLQKSLLSGANNKFQEIATLRKEMQTYMEQSKGQGEWTAERVQALANDPKFITAAQQVAGTSESSDEYSALSETEKKNLTAMQTEIANLKVLNAQAMQTQQQQLRSQQHTEFSKKYANYDASKIDQISYDMLNQKVQVTPEHIYKAWYHDENVNNAYQLGRKDERTGVAEKIASTSAEGITTSASAEKIEPNENETSQSFFQRIIEKNLKLAKAKG